MKKYIVQILVIVLLVGIIVAAQVAPYGTSRLFDMLKIGKQATIRELRDFSIEDTASVDRIFMVDKENNSVDLTEKSDGRWYVNDEFLASKHSINLLLKTIHRMRIKNPVAKSAEENIVKNLATKSVKVEVYDGDEILKTIYIGGVTQSQLGTYALLEGSDRPFVIEIPGFRGYLSSRFYTSSILWRSRRIFVYDQSEIDRIDVNIGSKPDQSFSVNVKGQHNYELYGPQGARAESFDTLGVRRFVKEFKHKFHSNFITGKTQTQIDSVYNSPLFYRFNVTLKNGNNVELSLHRENKVEDIDEDALFTLRKLHGVIDQNTLVIVQTNVFATMFKELEDFNPQF